MYQIVRENGGELGIAEKINYIKKAANGCYILTEEAKAAGVVIDGNVYRLAGREGLNEGEAESVMVLEFDGAETVRQARRNTAVLDYLSMMSGIELPEEAAETVEGSASAL